MLFKLLNTGFYSLQNISPHLFFFNSRHNYCCDLPPPPHPPLPLPPLEKNCQCAHHHESIRCSTSHTTYFCHIHSYWTIKTEHAHYRSVQQQNDLNLFQRYGNKDWTSFDSFWHTSRSRELHRFPTVYDQEEHDEKDVVCANLGWFEHMWSMQLKNVFVCLDSCTCLCRQCNLEWLHDLSIETKWKKYHIYHVPDPAPDCRSDWKIVACRL